MKRLFLVVGFLFIMVAPALGAVVQYEFTFTVSDIEVGDWIDGVEVGDSFTADMWVDFDLLPEEPSRWHYGSGEPGFSGHVNPPFPYNGMLWAASVQVVNDDLWIDELRFYGEYDSSWIVDDSSFQWRAGTGGGGAFWGSSSYRKVGPVPEPGTMMLLGAGILGLAGVRRKMQSKRH